MTYIAASSPEVIVASEGASEVATLEVLAVDLVISMAVTTLGKDRVHEAVVVVAPYIPLST